MRENENRLIISFIKPHKAVTSSFIARWLRTAFEEAGIDSSIFRAHSTRGASASAAARGGVTLEKILKAANYNSESVFERFYHKEVDRAAYGIALINDQNSLEEAMNNTVDI
uniref:Tyr recombinase domain-containing protein n=1 Tax=Amphimedon queenslandica TaxID=400682 RepID=A0A1X7TZX5_AMPQE